MKKLQLLLVVLALGVIAGGCRGRRTPASGVADSVVATVNGRPIREEDIAVALSKSGHKGPLDDKQRKNVLGVIIKRELAAQRAAALGLHLSPTAEAEIRKEQARLDALRRQALSDAFYRQEIEGKVAVTDEDARRYFAEHEAQLRMEFHIQQILTRNENEIEKARDELAKGAPFEEVAGQRFANLPEAEQRTWDLGFLRWNQLPEALQEVLPNLSTGGVSDIVKGSGASRGRFWIIRLVERREGAEVTFESEKARIEKLVKREVLEALREKTANDLRAAARIVYKPSPPPQPTNDEEM